LRWLEAGRGSVVQRYVEGLSLWAQPAGMGPGASLSVV